MKRFIRRIRPRPHAIAEPTIVVPAADDRAIARAFSRMRGALIRNTLKGLISSSRVRVLTILFCSAIFWVGLFLLFFEGFQFLSRYVALTNEIGEYLFGLFFLSLLVLLFFSNGIILYTGLFQSRESTFLLTTPASCDRIFAHKFLESIAFSSWGFLLLGSPMMTAYGIKVEAEWWFYAIFIPFQLAFVLIPGAAGAIGAILVANYLPRRPKTVLAVAIAAATVAGLFSMYQFFHIAQEYAPQDWMNQLLDRLEFSRNKLLPSRWMAAGVLASAREEIDQALFYLMVMTAHAALAYLIAAVVARDLLRQGHSRVQGGRSGRRRSGWYAFDNAFHRVFFFISRPLRLLILKDLRAFRRDPAQWSQFLIFFSLLAFYFVNIRRLGYDVQSTYWRVLISFLNLAVTALLLSTFTSRFIFPLLSLEGRNFWVLGLFPVRREAILWGKFVFACGVSLFTTEILVILSGVMLRIGIWMILLHMTTIAILCVGLSGISVGLGARFPDLKEEDPSKIATGLSGTLNLLVSLVFILIVVTTLALPCHLYYAGHESSEISGFVDAGATLPGGAVFRGRLALAIVAGLAFSAIATIVPLKIGINAFKKMEF